MPSTSATGTWVQFFDEWGCQHAYITFSGAQSVSELDKYKFTLVGSSSANGAEVGDHIESLVTGPQTWLIVYEDDDYNSKHSDKRKLYFGPNTLVRDLDSQYDFGDNIDSFQMYSSEPAGWPGHSQALNKTSTQLAIVEGPQLFSDLSKDLEDLVGALLAMMPDVGGYLDELLDLFWPSSTNPNEVWEAIQKYILKAVYTAVESSVMSDIENELKGIRDAILLYVNDQQPGQYDTLCMQLVDRASFFTYNDTSPATQYPTQKLPYTVAYFTIALAVFSARWRYFDQIYATASWYGGSEEAAKRQAFQEDLDTLLSDATAALKQMVKAACLEQEDWAKAQAKSGKLDEREAFIYVEQFPMSILGWLAPSFMWPCFGSTGQPPVDTVMHAITGPFGGAKNTAGGGHAKDAASDGQDITRLLVRCGSRVDCLQIWVDGQQQPLRGALGGNDVSDITFQAGEYVVAAFGYCGNIDTGALNQAYFRTNMGRQFGGGTPGSSLYQTVPPQGIGASLSGFTSALQPNVINSFSPIWRFQTPTAPGFEPLAGLELPG